MPGKTATNGFCPILNAKAPPPSKLITLTRTAIDLVLGCRFSASNVILSRESVTNGSTTYEVGRGILAPALGRRATADSLHTRNITVLPSSRRTTSRLTVIGWVLGFRFSASNVMACNQIGWKG